MFCSESVILNFINDNAKTVKMAEMYQRKGREEFKLSFEELKNLDDFRGFLESEVETKILSGALEYGEPYIPDFFKTKHPDLILDENAPLGMEMRDYLELDDYLFDISITANRPDCQSVVGIAREVAAALRKPFKAPDMSYTEDGTVNENISIEVVDKELCPRYLGHYIYDVQDIETPLWMKRRLIAVGHNAINAMVDITNYVLVEMGQPMHAFDLSTLEGSSIVVRRAEEGEELVTLDEKKRVLNQNNLLICDKVKAVGLAGVMGGLNSEIKDTTKTVLFESAKALQTTQSKINSSGIP